MMPITSSAGSRYKYAVRVSSAVFRDDLRIVAGVFDCTFVVAMRRSLVSNRRFVCGGVCGWLLVRMLGHRAALKSGSTFRGLRKVDPRKIRAQAVAYLPLALSIAAHVSFETCAGSWPFSMMLFTASPNGPQKLSSSLACGRG